MDVSESSDIEDEIKNIDDKSEDNRSASVCDPDQEEDNTDVKMESEEKKGRVHLFMRL
jgi:hypothetical protein